MARYKKDARGYFYDVIELDTAPGEKRQRKFIRAKTVGLLKEKIEKFHADQAAGGAPIRKKDDYTIGAWLDEWIAGEKLRGKIRPSTFRRYEMDIRNHLKPTIGALPLRPITLDVLQRLADRLYTSGHKNKDGTTGPLASRTIHNIWTPLIEAFDAAKKRGLLKSNIARDVELPEIKEPELYQITPTEMRRFLDVVRGDRFEALYWLSVLGFREGELLGLRRADVDLDNRTLRIAKGMQRVKQDDGGSKLTFIDPKTERAKRRVKFPIEWEAVLRAQFARLDELAQVRGWKDNDLVFPSTKGTPMEAQNFVSRHFKPMLTKAGLPADKIRFHDMRHGAASMLIALGYDARTVADILGHSSPEFTLKRYAFAFDEVKDRATADVAELLNDQSILEIPRRKQPKERE